MDDHPAPFTFAGRLVLLLAILIAVYGTTNNFWSWYDSRETQSESLAMLAFVPCMTATAFTIVCYWALRFFGIPFGKDKHQPINRDNDLTDSQD